MVTYIKAISVGFPTVQCSSVGDGSTYSNLVWEAGDPLPTKAVLDSYIAANGDLLDVSENMLLDGTPAFLDKARAVIRSVSERELEFNAKTGGSKNFYLNTPIGVSSNVKGHVLGNNSVLVAFIATIQDSVEADVVFEVSNKDTSEVLASMTIPAGQSVVRSNILDRKVLGTVELACYLRSSSRSINPSVRLTFARTN